jgi:hypothetical protein
MHSVGDRGQIETVDYLFARRCILLGKWFLRIGKGRGNSN